MEHNGHKKIEDAFHLLNQAAKEKKEELQNLLRSKYDDIREVLQETAGEKVADQVLEEGRRRLEEAASEVDAAVKKNPWPYVLGVAAAALIVGYLLGSSQKEK